MLIRQDSATSAHAGRYENHARTLAMQQFRRGDLLNGEQIVGGVGDHDVALTIVLDGRQ